MCNINDSIYRDRQCEPGHEDQTRHEIDSYYAVLIPMHAHKFWDTMESTGVAG